MDGDHESEDDGAPTAPPEREPSGERAGVYLAALAALAVPSLIVLALFLPALSPSSTSSPPPPSRAAPADPTPGGSGLDRIELQSVDETVDDPGVTADVAGAGLARGDVTIEIGEAVGIIADVDPTTDGDVQIAGPTQSANTTPPTTASSAPTTTTAGPAPTTTAPTTTTAGPDTTAPTTSSTTPPTTSATTTTTTTVPTEPADFAQRVDIGRIGEATVQFRFAASDDSTYQTAVRRGDDVVARTSGRARAGVVVNETVGGLDPGTPYTVEVILSGPPPASSPRITFRTSGDGPDVGDTEPVELLGLRLVDVGHTRFEVNYESNICANGSFVIREAGGSIVGRNDGQAAGCTTRHLAIPGFWTAPLEPDTTYVITVQVEANGAGRGNGNVATRSLTVTTGA